MAFKEFSLDENTPVKIYKRRGSSHIRLSVTAQGDIRVTMPTWLPYSSGLAFANTKREWIRTQQRPRSLLTPGQPIGKAHHLQYVTTKTGNTIHSRVMPSTVYVRHPESVSWQHPSVQAKAEEASVRALRVQAEKLLPQRLRQLAEQHGFTYNQVSVKRLKSRWGSCDSKRNIVLNLFLMQLPWECIDYVLLHELTHTEHLNHSPEFWAAMEAVLPRVKTVRKVMRRYQPLLHSVPHQSVA